MQKIRQTILVEVPTNPQPTKIFLPNCICVIQTFRKKKDKHKGIVHQNDVWHGGKSIAKKIML